VKSLGEAIADVHAGDGTPSALSGGLAGQALKNLQHTTTPDEAKRQYDIAIQETQNQLASARAKKPLELANFSGLGGGPGGLEPPANNNEIERLEAKLKELKEARDKVAGNEVMMGTLIGSAFDKGMEFGKAAGAALGEAFGPQIEKIKERLKIDDIKAGRGGGGGLMDQLKAIDPLTMKWLAGDGKGDGVDAQRGGAITNGAAQIWDKIVSDTFDKNAMRKAERQRDQQIKELIDIRKEHGVKLDQLIENTKGGKVAIAG
jgi:hypothetical protein